MKKAKRAISVLMCAALLLTLLPTAALAVVSDVEFHVSYANTATGTVQYKWDSASAWTVLSGEPDEGGTIRVPKPDTAMDHTLYIQALPGSGFVVNKERSGYNTDGGSTQAPFTDNMLDGTESFTVTPEGALRLNIEFDNNAGNQPVNANDIRFTISGSGSVSYKLGSGEFAAVPNNDLNFGENTAIIIKIAPEGNSTVTNFDVLANGQSIYASGEDRDNAKTSASSGDGVEISNLEKSKGYEVCISFSSSDPVGPTTNPTIEFTGNPSVSKGTFTYDHGTARVMFVRGENGEGAYDGNASRIELSDDTMTAVKIILNAADGYQGVLRTGGDNPQVPEPTVNGNERTYTFARSAIEGAAGLVSFTVEFTGDTPDPTPQNGVQFQLHGPERGTVSYKIGDAAETTVDNKGTESTDVNSDVITVEGENPVTVIFKVLPEQTNGYFEVHIDSSDPNEKVHDALNAANNGDFMAVLKAGNSVSFTAKAGVGYSIRVDFGQNLINWHTVSWGGGNVTVENGTVLAERVHLGDKTFTVNTEESGASDNDDIFPIEDIIGQQGQEGLGQYGLGYGDTDLFISNDITESVSIDFKFVPVYGYQLSDIRTNEENSLLSEFTASVSEISTFNFPVRSDGGNVHFNVVFAKTPDTIDVTGSTDVSGASIANGQNATNSGNLKLTVADLNEDVVSSELKAQAGESALYLDMNLYQVVSKAGQEGQTEDGNWETQLENLPGIITVTLHVPAPASGSTYFVIREHGEDASATYDRIEATFVPDANDPTTGTITFQTDKFSSYALAQETATPSVPGNTPSTPSTPSDSITTTPSQPTTSTETKPDGSTTTTESRPDGTVTESNTSKPTTDASGNTSQTTTETTTGKDGVTESKTETVTKPDGSASSTTESTTTKPDGTKTESTTETTINKDGSTASTTTATTTNKDGTVTESKTEATTSTVTNKDGSTTETKQETTTTSTGSKTESTTVTTVNKDGSTTATTTATTTDKAGTVTESKTESTTNKNGTTTEKTTTTETKANGTVTKSKTETTINKDGSSKATTTETVTKADGTKVESKTTATTSLSTNKTTGTVTETKKETTTTSDGVKSEGTTVTQIQKDGTVTSKETVKASDSTGTTATKTTTLDAKGNVTTAAEAAVSAKAVTEAAKTGAAVTIPVEVTATKSASTAPTVSVSVPKAAESVKVELPVQNVTPGTVAVIVNADGTEKIVSTSLVTENGVALKLAGSATVKLVDNSKSFKDVPENNVFYNEIASLSAREIMIGKTGDKFDLHNSVTLDQIANVAGRITGAVDVKDFNAGVAWGKDGGLKTGNVSATRGDVLKALYIAAGSPTVEDTTILAKFKDASGIPADMTAIAAWAAQNGILKGNTDGSAGLGNNVTRGQACALAGRTMGTLA